MMSRIAAAAPDDEPSMYGVHRFTIQVFLCLERAAVEALGDEKSLLLIDRVQEAPSGDAPHRTAGAVYRPDSLVSTNTPLLADLNTQSGQRDPEGPLLAPKYYVVCPRNRYCRYVANVVVILLLLAVEVLYYLYLSPAATSIQSLLELDIVLLPLMFSFWFVAPIHTALGHFSMHAMPHECRRNKEKLLDDRGARFCVAFSLVLSLLGTASEACLRFKQKESAMFTIIDIFLAVFSILVHVITVYCHLLLTTLAMRGILARLEEIDDELGTQLDTVEQRNSYSSARPDYRTMLVRWSESYYRLGEDMGLLSKRFGTRMILVIFLYLLQTGNLISSVWQSTGTQWTTIQTGLILFGVYVPNAAMLVMAVSSACYPVTICTQRIGPNLVVLAVRDHAVADGRTTHQISQVLANAFLLAPIEMLVGNFEVLPNVANTVTGVLVALFLLVLGYNVPA